MLRRKTVDSRKLNIGIFIIVYLLYCVLSLCFSCNVVNVANVHNTADNSNSAPVIAEVKKEISTETIKGNVYSKFLVQNFAKSVQIPYHICKKTKLVLTNGKESRRTCDYYYTVGKGNYYVDCSYINWGSCWYCNRNFTHTNGE